MKKKYHVLIECDCSSNDFVLELDRYEIDFLNRFSVYTKGSGGYKAPSISIEEVKDSE